ncbi:MAG: hypothetical protein A2V88_14120 [Elusimicrobia bacterium RBG_16_66_12]|nr:MAG: hypothetical protein A2V88_14120 [Elusimicrobia bacterium RBG_16_66_12]
MTHRRAILLAAAFMAAAVRASAELVLESVHWQVGRARAGRVASWADVKILEDGPPKLESRLRARLVLKNRGPQTSEGILLRYSLTSRLTPAGEAAAEGVWAIPFLIEERRVPKVGPNKVVEVPLETSPGLELYLRRLSRSGWWPDRLRLQVMLEPRPGERTIQILEDALEVKR